MNTEPKIKISNLNLSIGSHNILKNINVEIPENKITVLLGPSGCGKTTLLKTLNRLTDLYEDVKFNGSIYLDGEDILNTKKDVTKIRQKMGLLSQRPYPLPMSIYGNITYGLKIKGYSKKKILEEKVEQHLKEVNLWEEVKDRLHHPAAALSIGQQQRLCLARGLAVDPEIILADEPTSALDPLSSQAIEQMFLLLKNDYTIVLVTHILRQAKRMADNVVFMYLGEVVEQAPAEIFFEDPQKERTKSYLKGAFN